MDISWKSYLTGTDGISSQDTLVANAHKVRQIAEARVKTDKEDIKRLLTLLIADIVPEVWVPPMHVRELRSLVSFRWRLSKQIVMSKNRLHSVIQRFNLIPPEGKILADKNLAWWQQQDFSDLTTFQVERDLEIVEFLEDQKASIDQKLAVMSNSQPWPIPRRRSPYFANCWRVIPRRAFSSMRWERLP